MKGSRSQNHQKEEEDQASSSSSSSSSSEQVVEVSEEEQTLDQQALKLCEHALAGPITFHIHTCYVEPIPLHFNDINGMTCLEFYNQVMMKLEKEYKEEMEENEPSSSNKNPSSSSSCSSSNSNNSNNNNSNDASIWNQSHDRSSPWSIQLFLKDICINDYIHDNNKTLLIENEHDIIQSLSNEKPLREFISESLLKIEQNVFDLQVLYQDHPPQSLELQLPLHVKNRKTQSIVDQIEQFMSLPYDSTKPMHHTPQLSSYNFSTEMSVLDRKFIHAISSLYGVYHKSEGNANQRFIKISKESSLSLAKKKKRKEPNFPSGMSTVIEDFLYLGSGLDANDEIQIKLNQIECILNVTKEWPIGKSIPSYIEYKRIALKDEREESILPYFEQAFEFIEQALKKKKRILVHCVIGKSRSASFVLAFLMKHFNFNLKQAYDYLKERRELIRPNDGFIMQLMEYEYKLHQGRFTKVNIHMEEKDGTVENVVIDPNNNNNSISTTINTINNSINNIASINHGTDKDTTNQVIQSSSPPPIHMPRYLSTSLEWEFKETKQEKAIREKEMRKSKLNEEEEAELERTFLNDEKLRELLNECFPPLSSIQQQQEDTLTTCCIQMDHNKDHLRTFSKSQVQQFVKFVNAHPDVTNHPLFANANFVKFVHNRCAKWFVAQCRH